MHAVLGHATKNNKAQNHDDLGLETSDTKVECRSKMRYRHDSSTPAQSCARGWLQQSLKTQKDDMCECIAHNELLTACFFRAAKLQNFSELTKTENENLFPDMCF